MVFIVERVERVEDVSNFETPSKYIDIRLKMSLALNSQRRYCRYSGEFFRKIDSTITLLEQCICICTKYMYSISASNLPCLQKVSIVILNLII